MKYNIILGKTEIKTENLCSDEDHLQGEGKGVESLIARTFLIFFYNFPIYKCRCY